MRIRVGRKVDHRTLAGPAAGLNSDAPSDTQREGGDMASIDGRSGMVEMLLQTINRRLKRIESRRSRIIS